MTVGESKIEILSIRDENGKRKRKSTVLASNSYNRYKYEVSVTNLSLDELETLFYLVQTFNDLRRSYGEEETIN